MAAKPVSKRRRSALAASTIVFFALAPAAARAESIFDLFSPTVSASAVQDALARSGFVARSAIVRRGDVYLVDVSDRSGAPQRLIIDSHSGRLVERYPLRPSSWEVARRPDVRPRVDAAELGFAPRPEANVPVMRPNGIEAFPDETTPDASRVLRQRELAYGGGHVNMAPLVSPPDANPSEDSKPKVVRPKHIHAPVIKALPQTATAAPAATDSAATVATPPQAAPVAPASPQPAAAEPTAPTGMVASSGTPVAPLAKAPPPPQLAPALVPAKSKAINDIPVAPLD